MPKHINDKIKIQALCHLRKDVFSCSGFIEIHWIERQETYVSWQIIDEDDNIIGGRSQRFFKVKNH